MMFGLPLGFLFPALLSALALLPVLWWLLRLIPPRPDEVVFPPTRILRDLHDREHQARACPWWLIALRLLLAALVIVGLAHPVWRPDTLRLADTPGAVYIVIDNTWGAAPAWERMRATAERLIDLAQDGDRALAVVTTTAGGRQNFTPSDAEQARQVLAALRPEPYAPDREEIIAPLTAVLEKDAGASIYWLSDGVDHGNGAAFARALSARLPDKALHVFNTPATPILIRAVSGTSKALRVDLLRLEDQETQTGTLVARDFRNRPIAQIDWAMAPGEMTKAIALELPDALRNDIARLELPQHRSAAGVWLLDERWKRRRVGLIADRAAERAQPLLAPLYYVRRALSPYADLYDATSTGSAAAITELLNTGISVLVLSDVGAIGPQIEERLSAWLARGGVLVRFAGPRLASADETLLPVSLRRGGRVLGGALSWNAPQPLAGFAPGSPLAGLALPDDVLINRQVLAEPAPDLEARTWAYLGDGTPLITAQARGAGYIVLFHVSSDSSWSNLPLSGAFVEILRRTIALAAGSSVIVDEPRPVADTGAAAGDPAARQARTDQSPSLVPLRILDGYGVLGPPPVDAHPISPASDKKITPGRTTPPGLYGAEGAVRALNTLDNTGDPARLRIDIADVTMQGYRALNSRDLKPWLLATALVLLLADTLAVLFIGGFLRRRAGARQAATAAALLITASLVIAPVQPAHAQSDNSYALRASLDTRLAYVITGDAQVDRISERGLAGLSAFLTRHTSFEPRDPMGIDPERDELAFFPLLYWPISASARRPSALALANLETFMKQGGTILIDTRDQFEFHPGGSFAGAGSGAVANMRKILASLDIPALEPVPSDHVLTKAFYLLQEFPGRWNGSALWVEALPRLDPNQQTRPARGGDGVSPILFTANDFAGAWAVDENGLALFTTAPADPWQREMAYRAGVNIVMYALTGNYKADQVHVPDLLQRLGQ